MYGKQKLREKREWERGSFSQVQSRRKLRVVESEGGQSKSGYGRAFLSPRGRCNRQDAPDPVGV